MGVWKPPSAIALRYNSYFRSPLWGQAEAVFSGRDLAWNCTFAWLLFPWLALTSPLYASLGWEWIIELFIKFRWIGLGHTYLHLRVCFWGAQEDSSCCCFSILYIVFFVIFINESCLYYFLFSPLFLEYFIFLSRWLAPWFLVSFF